MSCRRQCSRATDELRESLEELTYEDRGSAETQLGLAFLKRRREQASRAEDRDEGWSVVLDAVKASFHEAEQHTGGVSRLMA